MVIKNAPSLDEWRKLYEAAMNFKEHECWNWMYDSDIFGVQDPESGEIGYCSILGNGGQHFAIAAYLGGEGLIEVLKMITGWIEPDDPDYMFTQKCIMCSFEDRECLANEDLKVIRGLGLNFHGKSQWPVFRDYEPGLFPWFINAGQCRFLTHILNQAVAVSLKCRNKKIMLNTETAFLVRTPAPSEDGKLIWKDQYLPVEFPDKDKEFISISLADELMVKRLKALSVKKNKVLEVDTFFAPAPVKDKGRPYFPKACLIVDHMDGTIISMELFKDINTEGSAAIRMLTDYMESSSALPSKLLVSRDETYYLLVDVCKQLDIKIQMVDKLEFIAEARQNMFDMLSNM